MRDQLLQIARKDGLGIMLRLVRLGAKPVGAKVGHDHPETRLRDARRMAEPDPVGAGVGKQAVEQDRRPALAQLVIGELDPVGCRPIMNFGLAHPGNLPVAAIHLSTSF